MHLRTLEAGVLKKLIHWQINLCLRGGAATTLAGITLIGGAKYTNLSTNQFKTHEVEAGFQSV